MSDNVEYMRVYMLNRYHKRRNEAILELGGHCRECGTTERLELDHKDPAKKQFSLSRAWSVSEVRFREELAKCQLLCVDCHAIKSILESGRTPAKGTHGTVSAYRYCGPPKCAACKDAKRVVTNEWRHRTGRRKRR